MTGLKPDKAFLFAENLHNIGDLALVLQLAHGLKNHCGIDRLTVRQWQLPSPEIIAVLADQGIDLQSGKSVRAFFHRRTLLLYGGGQAVRDNSSVASMLAVAATMVFSHIGGNARVALAIGISPLKSKWHICLWRLILGQFALLTTRDQDSLARARSMVGPATFTALTADLAFLPSPLHSAIGKKSVSPAIIIAPCDHPQEGRCLDVASVVAMARQIGEQLGIRRFMLLAHDPRPEMDLAACRTIATALQAAGNYDVEILASVQIGQYFEAYASAAAVITNRLHSVIFSLLSQAPVFVIGDGNDKLQNVARQFDIPVLPQTDASTLQTTDIIAATLSKQHATSVEEASDSALQNFTLLNRILQRRRLDIGKN